MYFVYFVVSYSPALVSAQPPVTALSFTPDGKSLVIGSQAGLVVRTLENSEDDRRIASELTVIHDLAFGPQGDRLAVAGGRPGVRGVVEIYDWPSLELEDRVEAHEEVLYAAEWSPDGTCLVVASLDASATLIRREGERPRRRLEGHSQGVLAASMLPGDQGLVTGGLDEALRVWSPQGLLLRTMPQHRGAVHDLELRPPTEDDVPPLLASASDDRTVRFWQPAIGRLVRFVRLPAAPLCLAWRPGGKEILAGCRDGHVRIVDSESVEVHRDLPLFDGPVYSIAADPRGDLAAAGGPLGKIDILEIKMQNAKCEMRNAKCEMQNAKCKMRNARCTVTIVLSHRTGRTGQLSR